MAQNDIIEPNFEGEEMKLPTSAVTSAIPEPKSPSLLNGPIIILLFTILVALLAGLYYWYTIVMSTPVIQPEIPTRPTAEENNEPESTTAEARTNSIDVVSTSDDLDAIEADANSTNFDDMDAEATAIDTEMEEALSTSI